MSAIEIRIAKLSEIIDLRHATLRAGLPREAAIFAGDELDASRHFGAFVREIAGSPPVGCASLHLNQWEGAPAWQLRGMATAADYRGKGIGRMLLQFIERALLAEPSTPQHLWCNARTSAEGFYRHLGWETVSQPFEIPTAGPHVRMTRNIDGRFMAQPAT